MRTSTFTGSVLIAPLLFLATGALQSAPAQAMTIQCMPFYLNADYDTMCIVYHDDGASERFFVRAVG
jgi:hypothetical protein